MIKATTLCAALTLCLSQSVSADVLLIEAVAQDNANPIQRPSNGMSMDSVQASYGEPGTTHGPIGDPPITRWDYDGYSVYFEYDLVLHSVLQKSY